MGIEKFRWTLAPHLPSACTFVNAGFGGMLYVSDHSFESAGRRMTSVYVGEIGPQEATGLRHVWRIDESGENTCHIVSMFNEQVLCQSHTDANPKGDRWMAVADKQSAHANEYTLSLQWLPVGS